MSARLDGVTLAILTRRLEGIARKMANTLLRTGRSGVLNIARDFSCCIVTEDCRLLVTNEALPIHVLSGPDIMARFMKEFHPRLAAGDGFLHNSPYHGCSHAADHTFLVPVVDAGGRHRLTIAIKAHQADIGNSIPTTYHGAARDVYEEGALIFPCVQVQKSFETNADFIRMCQLRIRVPEQWHGDFLAMVGAARIGERELLELAGEIGWDAFEAYQYEWLEYSQRRMSDAIRKMPAGTAVRRSRHDPFPGTPADGIPICVKVSIQPQDGLIEVDLTDNPDCLPCGLNLSEACSRTAAMVGVFNAIDGTVPKNSGSFTRVRVLLRENCVVGIPKHPISTSVATTNIADRVANAVQAAIADIAKGYGLAECGAVIPPAVGVISGLHPQTGAPFINQVFLGMTGGAGAPRADAWLTIGHVGNAGLCFIDSVELDEMRQPIHIYERRLLQDSEGAGQFRGAPSIAVEFGPVNTEISVGYVSDGAINAAQGVRGGHTGGHADQKRVRLDGTVEPLDACAQVTLGAGERILSISTGGGGYGPPSIRDPEQVAADVREKWISAERAGCVLRRRAIRWNREPRGYQRFALGDTVVKLENRIALVTGGTQGIGQAVVERFAAEGAFSVVIASKDIQRAESVAASIRASGGRAGAEVADVTDREQIRGLVARVVGSHGCVDVLVNCAGVFVPTPAGEHADAAVDRTLDINLKGTFNSIDAVVPHMKARRSGKIINIASVAGVMGIGGYAMYCATKAGIVMLTRALACELAPHGININAIAPGNTATPMNADIRSDAAFAPMLQAMAARTPSGRVYSTPAEMAAMAAFLASDEARAMHGSTVLMDEGFSAGL